MNRSIRSLFAAAILLTAAVHLNAGGLFITLGNPEVNAEAASHNAVLTLKLTGCGEPAKASIDASAVGIVEGHRQTIPLRLITLSEPGAYAVTQQWPDKGRWVLQFVAKDGARITSTLVAAGPKSVDRYGAKMAMRAPAEEDIAALLTGKSPSEPARK